MKKLIVVLAVLALLCLGGIAQAAPIQGLCGWAPMGPTISGSVITIPLMFCNTGGSGNLVNLPAFEMLSSGNLDLSNPTGWTFGSATTGYWMTTGGTCMRNGNYFEGNLVGTFTPGTAFNGLGLQANTGIMIINGNLPGFSTSIALNTASVPEPSSIIVLLGGLGSILAFRRRRA